jgi:hypothetical protein
MMYRSGKLNGRVTRCQLADRLAEITAIATNTAVHRRVLKGFKKFSQFVEIPGSLMYSEDLMKQRDFTRSRLSKV